MMGKWRNYSELGGKWNWS